jgi:hypothetical protein
MCLTTWLADKAGQAVFHIDPLKINAGVVTAVMSYAFAERHGILAVQVLKDEVSDCQRTTLSSPNGKKILQHTFKG